MECTSWRACEKGSLQGFADIKIEKWGVTFRGCKLFMKNGHRWISPPSNEYQDSNGEKKYSNCIQFITKDLSTAFSDKALEAVDIFCKDKSEPIESSQESLPF